MGYGLSRLLRDENAWSDLLVLLAERDEEPLRSAFGLPDGPIEIKRECAAGAGRADIVVFADTVPWVIVEVKRSAEAHGDQFAKYDTWADGNGVPPERRHVVGPTVDPIPGVPDTWSQNFTIASLLNGWRDSGDCFARGAAIAASDLIKELTRQVNGPASAVSDRLADRLRLRSVQHRVRSLPGLRDIEFGKSDQSQKGFPNICAWREVGRACVSVEVQRLEPGDVGRSPFAVWIMVGKLDAEAKYGVVADSALTRLHEQWLAPRSILRDADAAVRALVADPDADGLKSRRGGKGDPRYYGYRDNGRGTRMPLRPDVTLEDLARLYGHVVAYLLTYQSV